MKTLSIYGHARCRWCHAAKLFVETLRLPFNYYDIESDEGAAARLAKLNPDYETVPQIFVEGEHLGGYTDLVAAYSEKRLIQLLGE